MKDNPRLRVKEICKERGMTLKDLAKKMVVAPESLTRAVAENSNPTLSTLHRIATNLDLGIDDLLVDSKSVNQICGHVEVEGIVYTIKSLADLERLYDMLIKEAK